MTTLEIILVVFIYLIMFRFVYFKQLRVFDNPDDADVGNSFMCGIFWPIALTVYLIRQVFADWYVDN